MQLENAHVVLNALFGREPHTSNLLVLKHQLDKLHELLTLNWHLGQPFVFTLNPPSRFTTKARDGGTNAQPAETEEYYSLLKSDPLLKF